MASPYTYRDGLARVGPTWHFRFMWKGKRHAGSTGVSKRADAVMWLRRYQDNLAKDPIGLAPTPTVRAAWENWKQTREGKVSQATMVRSERAVTQHILPVCAELSVNQVNDAVVEKILSRYLEGQSKRLRGGQRTKNGANVVLSILKVIIRPMVNRGFLRTLPWTVKPLTFQKKAKVFLPPNKVDEFLAAVDRTGNAHQQIAIRAMLRMGLRETEALDLRWGWFQDDLETYTPGKTKGKEAVPLPVPPDLKALIRQQTALSPWVIPAEDGRPHRPQYTVKAILRGGEAVGIEGLTPHRMRTTCATLMSRALVPPAVIQMQLRHKDIQTTMGYIEVGAEDLRNAMHRTWGG